MEWVPGDLVLYGGVVFEIAYLTVENNKAIYTLQTENFLVTVSEEDLNMVALKCAS